MNEPLNLLAGQGDPQALNNLIRDMQRRIQVLERVQSGALVGSGSGSGSGSDSSPVSPDDFSLIQLRTSIDRSIASNTTPGTNPDPDLNFTMRSGLGYTFFAMLNFDAGTGGLKVSFTVPSSVTGHVMSLSHVVSNVISQGDFTGTYGSDGPGAGVILSQAMFGSILPGSAGGQFNLNWAQLSSSVTPTILKANSSMLVWPLK